MKRGNILKLRKSLCRALGGITAAALIALPILTEAVTVSATGEIANQTVTYVYHQHIGSSTVSGGCYKMPIKHVHTGSETEYGGCYQTPVYHVHQGDEASGGGCYGKPVLHVHTGSESEGDGCYTSAIIHQSHTAECMKLISSTEHGCYVVSSQETGEYDENGNTVYSYYMSCGYVVNSASSEHIHSVEQCVGIGNVEYYELGCGKTEETVDKYELNCKKDENTIEYYSVSCSRTTEDIEGYSLSCGKDETTPYGKIILTEEKTDDPGKVRITVSFEDLTDGSLQTAEDPYTWYDDQGNVIGTGDYIEVSENGSYIVKVSLVNEDVDKDSLTGTIDIGSIEKAAPTIAPDGTPAAVPSSTPTAVPSSTPTAVPSSTPTAVPSSTPSAATDVMPSASPAAPAFTPAVTPATSAADIPGTDEEPAGIPADSASENGGVEAGENQETAQEIMAAPSKSPERGLQIDDSAKKSNSDSDAGVQREREDGNFLLHKSQEEEQEEQEEAPSLLRKQVQDIVLPEFQSENDEVPEIKVTKPEVSPVRKFFSSPVVKMISITAAALIMLLGLLLLLYLLMTSVCLYNDDGEGRLIYLGRCKVSLKEEGYVIGIPEALAEKAVTNRYCIKPGLFRLFRSSEEEIIVCRQDKRVSVYLSKEMFVTI